MKKRKLSDLLFGSLFIFVGVIFFFLRLGNGDETIAFFNLCLVLAGIYLVRSKP